MTNETLISILNALPYPVVFVDREHIIRFMNTAADYFYHTRRGYPDRIGRSLFECHSEESREMIEKAVEKLAAHGNEIFVKVNTRNERVYITPVRDSTGTLIGYFERFEANFSI